MTKDHFDIHAEITNRVVAAIEKGAKDFKMPWHDPSCSSPPSNAVTKKTYRGINTLMLWIAGKGAGHPSSEWATFKQWQERGAQVRKGERGTPIVFYKTLTVAASAPGQPDERTIPFARASFVFNAAQVDGYAAPVVVPRSDMPRMDQLADAGHI